MLPNRASRPLRAERPFRRTPPLEGGVFVLSDCQLGEASWRDETTAPPQSCKNVR